MLAFWVETWFKQHTYAIILLREAGISCVFCTAFYGSKYQEEKGRQTHEIDISYIGELEPLMRIRNNNAYGDQYEYWNDPDIVGWTRTDNSEKQGSGCAVLLSNGDDGKKYMSLGHGNAHKK